MKDKFLGTMSILIFVSIIVNIILNIYTLNKIKNIETSRSFTTMEEIQ